VALRAGGNRTGAEAAMISAAGYPMAIDYSHGVPRYRPHDGSASSLLTSGLVDAALVVGDARLVDHGVVAGLTNVPCVAMGPGASGGPLAGSRVVIDTARAGIHEAGTALRMDDVPLPLRALVTGPPPARDLLATLAALVATGRRRSAGVGARS
jgi:formylmethanofuran dehydrogenase subunit B